MSSHEASPKVGRLRPGTVFQLTRELVSLPETLKLRNVEWGVLFAVTGEHTLAQIRDHFALTSEQIHRIFHRLLEAGLIREREVSYGEYLRAAATIQDDEPKTLARFLRAGITLGQAHRATQPVTASPAARPAPPTAPPSRPVSSPARDDQRAAPVNPRPAVPDSPAAPALREDEGIHQTRAIPTFSREEVAAFRPLSTPPAPSGPRGVPSPPPSFRAPEASDPTPAAGPTLSTPAGAGEALRLSLKRVMRFILDRAPDLNAGQLDVYRVFIRVNTKLLRRNGIHTLRFEEDHLISDPELQLAITSSVEKTLGLSCPQETYVAG